MMTDEIHVVLNRLDLSDDYNEYAGATMASVLENCSKPVVFHITHDGNKSYQNMSETNANIAKYQELVSKYGARVEFHDLDKFEWDKRLPDNIVQKWPSICLSRLQFQDIFPKLDKIILLGTDVIVMTDLSVLWDNSLGGHSIGAVPDMGLWLLSSKNRRPSSIMANPDISKYFNSDVLVYNLKRIRQKGIIIRKSVEYLSTYSNPSMNEQDTLNFVFNDDTYLFPQKFNLIPSQIKTSFSECISDTSYPGFIIHYAGSEKPWMPKFYYNSSNYNCIKFYLHYASLTPWNNNTTVEEIFWNSLPKPFEVIQDLDKYIWIYPIHKKVKIIWNLLFNLIKHFLHR